MIIGILGRLASGKDTVAEYLQKHGFSHVSLSAILREEATKRNIAWTRENLMKLGTELKNEKGSSVLAQLASSNIHGDTVITSLRHPDEVQYFIDKYPDFKLISIESNIKTRYQRAVDRDRIGDSTKSFDEFKRVEDEEEFGKGGQNVKAVFSYPHIEINNNGTLEDLYLKIDELLNTLKD